MSVTATANQPTASSGTITFSWTTANASSWSVLFQYATTVNGTYTTLSTTTGSASGLQTAAYTTPTTSYYYRTTITAQGTGGPATSTSTSLYYYNPFQGPQGVQGVQGIAGSDGLRGPDGPQGLQGIQGIVNFSGGGGNVANYVITTTNNAGTINANANMTYDGSIFVVTGTGAHKLGPVTFTNGAITSVTNLTGTGTLSMGNVAASGTTAHNLGVVTFTNGAITGVTNLTGTGTLSMGNVAASGTTAHNLGLVTFTNGAITGVTTLNTITIGSTGNVSSMGTLGCGAITSSGALGLGANTITSGNHVPSANNSYNLGAATTGLWANVYATNLLGVTALNTITLSGNNVSSMGTLGCGAITNAASTSNNIGGLVLQNAVLKVTSGNIDVTGVAGSYVTVGQASSTAAFQISDIGAVVVQAASSRNFNFQGSNSSWYFTNLVTPSNVLVVASNGNITNGASTVNSIGGVTLSNSTLVASTANVEHRLGNVTFNTNTISWAGDGDTGFTFVSDGIFNVVNNNVVMAQFNYNGLDMKTKPISNAGAITSASHYPDQDDSRMLGTTSYRWTSVCTTNLNPGASALSITGTTGTSINTLTVGAPATTSCNAIYTSGTVSASDFTATSDRRLKSDILTISNALDIVKGMRGVYFTRLGETRRSVGVIAQEVEEVLPEVVHGDDMKSVSYGNIVGLLIEAVKTLSERIEKMNA